MFYCNRILLICAGLFLSGCSMIPRYERPAAGLGTSFPGESAESSNRAAEEIGWRDFFDEPRLLGLIGLSLTNNHDLRVAVLNVEQSRAQYRIYRASSLPEVSGSSDFARSHASDRTVDAWSARIGMTSYEVDFFGRVRSLNAQALQKFLATIEGRKSAQIALVSELASHYFTLQQLKAQLEVARQTLSSVEESYALNGKSFQAGNISELDVRIAESQVQSARIGVVSYERRIAQAENYLALLVGGPIPANLPPALPFDAERLVAAIPAGLPSELVQRRPDILEAEYTLMAANAQIGAARAAFFPSVRFNTSIGTTSSQFDQLLSAGTGVWSFSPQITVPLFSGGRNRADFEAAKVGAAIAVANYQKAIHRAFREVADALVADRSYSLQASAQTALVEAQRRRLDLATLRYRQGDGTYLEVLSAQQDHYSAQQSDLETRLNRLVSRIALYKALGGGWK